MTLYTLIIHLYAFAVGIVSPFHRKARMMRRGQRKTLGMLLEKIDRSRRYVWFHAASLGEFEQGRPLIEAMKVRNPDCGILLTFFSPSGYEVRKDYQVADVVCYLPFDTPRNVGRFIRLANPSMAFFIKYEFWANYLLELKRRGIPAYSVSSIFRPGQLFFRWYGRPYLEALRGFDRLFVQDAASEQLLAARNIRRVTVSGDTRFDRVVDEKKKAFTIPQVETFVRRGAGGPARPTIVAGSTWGPDEDILIRYFNRHPGLRLIIAPHEISSRRVGQIRSRLCRQSVCLSDVTDSDANEADCLVVDNFGLLSSIYRYADVAYVGGGFGKGIHNILEAAVYAVPVVFGPAHHKAREARNMIAAGAAFTVTGRGGFDSMMDDLLADHDLLRSAGKAAGSFVLTNAGATDRILSRLKLTSL
ncbi:MAG: 3-deoxy-D-manno-octulosonic acid transferase [Tannerellaceae bacterium]|jgi:3-deoxy-D-manno-octulosonic-acid transferase|nr:3-deoxy-D-manno-octulosonic acid transferase [Tannerellaceae bacterium]